MKARVAVMPERELVVWLMERDGGDTELRYIEARLERL